MTESFIAHYKVAGKLGAGGMGEVFRATDTKLNREVAIKVLPETFATSKERLARFEREAQVLASLNHPNIAAIHGLEESEGRKALILELVEGETLAERLKRGALPIQEALELCQQIAAALEAAHEKGIIHRDLKPGNVKFTADDKVKVLDFGLAKATLDSDSGQMDPSDADSPTITEQFTQPGVILGTAAYMSPEQARGKPVDKRTDIWAFGCVLFECLSGRRVFEGETATDIIGALIHKEPDWSLLPPATAPAIRHLLKQCLSKNIQNRLRDIGDAGLEITAAVTAEIDGEETHTKTNGARTGSPLRWAAGIVVMLFVAALGFVAGRMQDHSSDRQGGVLGKRVIKLTDHSGPELFPRLAPDGNSFVFASPRSGNEDIYLQRVGGFNPINLTANYPEDDSQPAFSPDGQWIAFRSERAGGGLYIMGATGESPRRLTDSGFNPAWSPDGKQVLFSVEGIYVDPYHRERVSHLWSVEVETGETKRLTQTDAVQPHWSPHGHRIAYWALKSGSGQRDIFTIAADGGPPVPVTDDPATDWNPVWGPNGQFLYYSSDRGGAMNAWRVAIDEETGKVRGKAEPVLFGHDQGMGHVDISQDSRRMVFSSIQVRSRIEKIRLDAGSNGNSESREVVNQNSTAFRLTDLSPDGQWLVLEVFHNGQEDLFLLKGDGSGERRQLTNDFHKERGGKWTRHSDTILFYSDATGIYALWRIQPDGSGRHLLLPGFGNEAAIGSLSDTEDRVAFTLAGYRGGTRHEAAIIDLSKEGQPGEPQIVPHWKPQEEDCVLGYMSWSPDGMLLGSLETALGRSHGIGLFDPDANVIEQLWPKGGFPIWLDASGDFVFIGDDHHHIFRANAQTRGAPTEILAVYPDRVMETVYDEKQNMLYYRRVIIESDVWMVEFE